MNLFICYAGLSIVDFVYNICVASIIVTALSSPTIMNETRQHKEIRSDSFFPFFNFHFWERAKQA